MEKKIAEPPDAAGVKTVDDIITIFHRKLCARATTSINDTFSRMTSRPIANVAEMSTVLSIPAIWDYKMENRMKEAARRANLVNPRTVSEPVAAAMFMRSKEPEKLGPFRKSNLSDGMNHPFLVVDCGGGTTVRSDSAFMFDAAK